MNKDRTVLIGMTEAQWERIRAELNVILDPDALGYAIDEAVEDLIIAIGQEID